tara:strand:+ start:2874 stop:3026 length:153 start_codon:yes stop_codon:yes gene_type:complete
MTSWQQQQCTFVALLKTNQADKKTNDAPVRHATRVIYLAATYRDTGYQKL